MHIDLGRVLFPLFLVVWFLAPYPRGLFFAPDVLPFEAAFGCLLALMAFHELLQRYRRPWGREIWAALLVPALYGLSFLVAVDRHSALMEFLKYLNYFAVIFIVSTVASLSRLRWMAYVLLASAAGVEMVGLFGALGLSRFPGASDAGVLRSTFGYQNAFGGYLLAVFAVGTAIASTRPGLFSIAIAGLNYLTSLCIVATYSRGTWVLFPVMSITLLLLLPLGARWKSLYSSIASLTCTFLVLRGFTQATAAKNAQTGLKWLLAGFVAAVLLETGWIIIQRFIVARGGLDRKHRTVVVVLCAVWAFVLLASYFAYAFTAYPNFLAMVFPRRAIVRAEAIKSDEQSLLTRLDYIRTAVRIWSTSPLLGFGGGAWNALYHQYQTSLYWTTEVHSHPFQMLVEAGIGVVLAFLGIWYFVIRRVLYALADLRDEDRTLIAGVLAGTAILGIHSAFDFDLSFPSNAYLVWGFLGALGGVAYQELRGIASSRQGPGGEPGHETRERAPVRRAMSIVRLAIPFAVAAVLCVVPLRLYRGGEMGSEAARLLSQNNFAAAERTYLKALEYDPYNSGFYIDLAHSQVASYLLTRQEDYRARGDKYLTEALRLGKYDLPVRLRAVDLLMI
ncbi:MAG: O-antigen ligase family protein, partial [Bacillota bacterium]|nr:O-antigen ligase family protein [Bacillota bacterium]